jgi:hypothetical protein
MIFSKFQCILHLGAFYTLFQSNFFGQEHEHR